MLVVSQASASPRSFSATGCALFWQAKQAVSQAAPEAVQSKASKALSKGKQSLAEAAPGSPDTDSPEEQLKEAASTVKKSFFEVLIQK